MPPLKEPAATAQTPLADQAGTPPRDYSATRIALGIAVLLSIGFAVLLPVIPVVVERRGHAGDAGAATAALLATTVLSEFLAPALMARFSSRFLVIGGMLLVGLPCLAYLIPNLDVRLILLATSARGVGFGVAGVVCMAITARQSAPESRGVAMGLYGTAFTLPLVVFPPLGLFLLGAGLGSVAAGTACAAGVAGAIAGLWLTDDPAGASPLQLRKLLPHAAVLAVLPTLIIVNMTFGAVVSFIPVVLPVGGLLSAATFLLVSGIARVIGRLVSGVLADRFSPQVVMLGGAVAAMAGLAALPLGRSAPLVLVGATVYGLGAGSVQTAGFIAMLKTGRNTDIRVVSGAWNTAVDIGTGSGAAVLGLVAASFGYAVVLWVLPLVAAAAVPAALLSIRAARAPS